MIAKAKPVALFIGRFQPFHRGHLFALRWIASRSSKVIIAIGSAQKSFEPKNPFTAKERLSMVKKELGVAGLSGMCRLVAVTDVNNNDIWVTHMDRHLPKYDVVYSNNPLVLRLMKQAGKKVNKVPFFKRVLYDATKIRARMKKHEKWQDRVPKKVGEILKRLKAEERVEKL